MQGASGWVGPLASHIGGLSTNCLGRLGWSTTDASLLSLSSHLSEDCEFTQILLFDTPLKHVYRLYGMLSGMVY